MFVGILNIMFKISLFGFSLVYLYVSLKERYKNRKKL